MKRSELTEFLCRATEGMPCGTAIEQLMEWGVVSERRCEQQAIRTEVERLFRQGAGRCEAMEAAADTFHCSYSKVREAVYYKPKN